MRGDVMEELLLFTTDTQITLEEIQKRINRRLSEGFTVVPGTTHVCHYSKGKLLISTVSIVICPLPNREQRLVEKRQREHVPATTRQFAYPPLSHQESARNVSPHEIFSDPDNIG
jgi:hypothetical protein